MDVKDLINALSSGDNVAASNVFNGVMADRINSAMDDKKIELGQSMMGGQVDVEEDPVEEVEEDENVQSDSDDDES